MDFLILPFTNNPQNSYLYSVNFDYRTCFRVYTKYGELLPFICPVSRDDFRLEIVDYLGEVVRTYSIDAYLHSFIKKGNQDYLLFPGGPVQCLDLEPCDIPYRIKIDGYYSEYFWIGLDRMTKFYLSNRTSFKNIPYGIGFAQWFYLQLPITDFSVQVYQNVNKDESGTSNVKYSRIFKSYDLIIFDVPSFVNNIFQAFNAHDSVKITTQAGEVLELEQAETEVKSERHENSFGIYDLTVNFTSTDQTDSKACSVETFTITQELTEVINITTIECVPIERIETTEIDC